MVLHVLEGVGIECLEQLRLWTTVGVWTLRWSHPFRRDELSYVFRKCAERRVNHRI